MVWLAQNCRSIKCLQFLKPPELRGGGFAPPHGPPTRALPTTRWGTLSDSQTPCLLTPPLITNPGSAPATPPICQYDGTINDCHTSERFVDPPFSWEIPVPSREYEIVVF